MKMLLRSLIFLLTAATAAFAATEENVNQEFDVSPGGKLVIDVDFGNLDISTGPGNKVTVKAHRKIEASDEAKEKEYFASTPLRVSKDGNVVSVIAERSGGKHDCDGWHGHRNMDADYTVQVPAQFNAELHTGGGAIAAKGISGEIEANTNGGKLKFEHLRGPLEAKTSGGNIQLAQCEGQLEVMTSGGAIEAEGGKGTLEAKTSGGSITVSDFQGDMEVKTSGGKLTLDRICGKLIGKTSGGSITAELISPINGDVSLETSAGSIDVVLPRDAAFDIEAETSVGSVTHNLPMETTQSERDELKGSLNGGGKSLYLRSSAGSIAIKTRAGETARRERAGTTKHWVSELTYF